MALRGLKRTPEEIEKSASKRTKFKIGSDELRAMYCNQGLSTCEIANRLGCDSTTVGLKLAKAGIETRRGPKRGRVPWNKGKKLPYEVWNKGKEYLRVKGSKNPMHRPEVRAKVANSLRGKPLSEEAKRKIGMAHRGKPLSDWHKQKILRSLFKRPTKPEAQLIKMIECHNLPFEYTGNGKKIVAGRNPDFVHTKDPSRVIELFGIRWHSPLVNPKVKPEMTYEGRVGHFRKNGVRCLVIWDTELHNESRVVDKIREFAH